MTDDIRAELALTRSRLAWTAIVAALGYGLWRATA